MGTCDALNSNIYLHLKLKSKFALTSTAEFTSC